LLVTDTQFELGAYPTSPIETFAGTVTRAIDNISLATSLFPHSATVWTQFVEVYLSRVPDTTSCLLDLSDGTGNERSYLSAGTTTFTYSVDDGGAPQASDSTMGSTTVGVHKLALAATANDFAAVVDNGTPSTDGAGTMPTVTTLYFGVFRGSTLPANAHIRKVMILPRRMSNGNMGTLTT
jgi:hypothetical protein